MTETQPEVNENDLPSIDLIYPLAIESYDMTERMKTQDERIRHIITLALAITAAVPASFQLFGITPNLICLAMAGGFFLLCLTLCIIASAMTELVIVSVKSLFDDYLHVSEFTTKLSIIKSTGIAQKKNIEYLDKRHRLLIWAILLLAVEIMFLAASGLFGL